MMPVLAPTRYAAATPLAHLRDLALLSKPRLSTW